jgi:hypothetical protein
MRRRRFPSLILLAILAVFAGAVAWSRSAPDLDLNYTAHTDETILQMLDHVQVLADRPNPPGYDRDCGPSDGCVFGTAWKDVDHNGCDTRNDILGKQLTDVVFKPGTRQCKVKSGKLRDPYTGGNLLYPQDPIEIDHVFPLAYAWDMGAAGWPIEQRTKFANDPVNLLATSRTNNRAKSDKSPAEWTDHVAPTERCGYADHFLTVALAYHLPITRADADALRKAANNCV